MYPIIKETNVNILKYLTINTKNITESKLKELLKDTYIPKNINLTFIPKIGRVDLYIYGKNQENINNVKNNILENIKKYVWGYNQKSPMKLIHNILIKNNLTISFAESCTGGLVSKFFTDISGSSKYFKGSIISYSNDFKINQLNINKNILDNYGAVSEQTAIMMAKNIKIISKTDIGASITGIAGPNGGTKQKPIGIVFLAINYKNKIICKKYNFSGSRKIIRHKTAEALIFLILDYL